MSAAARADALAPAAEPTPAAPAADAPTLAEIAFALLAVDEAGDSPEAGWLAEQAARVDLGPGEAPALLARWRGGPPGADRRLRQLAAELPLELAETLALALVCAAETDAMAARVLAWLQAPVGGGRPTAGLVARLAAALGDSAGLAALATGLARESGALRIADEGRPLPEATLTAPQPIVFALADPPRLHWPGLPFAHSEADRDDRLPLPPSLLATAADHARALGADRSTGPAAQPAAGGSALLIRSGHPREGRAVAAEVAAALGARPIVLEGEVPPGFGIWLRLAGAVPVLALELLPGERRRIAAIAGWRGPLLVVAGPDGHVEFDGESVPGWRVPIPPAAERQALWRDALGTAADGSPPLDELALRLGRDHRHAAGRIAELGRAARFEARLADAAAIDAEQVARASRGGASGDAGALAELVAGEIGDDALVLPSPLRGELEALALRCLGRDGAADGLGPAIQARFRPGVRALFVGPSGTGKSLAVGWLASRLGLPLFRVDLASVSSKYIGETEKNLAQLFARAEHAEVVLMFDEADALFGKRTDVKDSNDRFANAQTNYLLTRIESYEGIAILTSNSRARFDSAFTRRLDAILDFPAPLPQERRALWLAHLGEGSSLGPAEMNRLAVACDLAGGHIRNVVLAAAAAPRREHRPIGWDDLVQAIAGECRKLGRPMPHGLL